MRRHLHERHSIVNRSLTLGRALAGHPDRCDGGGSFKVPCQMPVKTEVHWFALEQGTTSPDPLQLGALQGAAVLRIDSVA
jgi:hypothetical protein